MALTGCVHFCFILMVLAGCSGGDRPAERGALQLEPPSHRLPPRTSDFRSAPCPFDAPTDRPVECGFLTVPEGRSAAGSPGIELAVAIAYSMNESALPDPVVYLEGGPGGAALDNVFSTRIPFLQILNTRDLIVFDQRGTGYSKPALDCVELNALGDSASGGSASLSLGDCAGRLRRTGIDLDAYDTRENAADVESLRVALGYENWNLYGISYGSRLALTTLRNHPRGIRSIVIDGVLPLQEDFFANGSRNAQRAFELLFRVCAADAACATDFPSLGDYLRVTVAALDANPALLELTNGTRVRLSGGSLMDLLFLLLYSAENLKYVPAIIDQTGAGDYTIVTQIVSLLNQRSLVSYGMYFSVMCADEVPFTSPAEFENVNGSVDPLYRRFSDASIFEACEAFAVEGSAALENQAVTSNSPALVTSGEFDPVTPPSYGEHAAASLANADVHTLPGQSHGASMSLCGQSLVGSFLANPSSPDAGCVAGLSGPVFRTLGADGRSKPAFARSLASLPEEALERLRRAPRHFWR